MWIGSSLKSELHDKDFLLRDEESEIRPGLDDNLGDLLVHYITRSASFSPSISSSTLKKYGMRLGIHQARLYYCPQLFSRDGYYITRENLHRTKRVYFHPVYPQIWLIAFFISGLKQNEPF